MALKYLLYFFVGGIVTSAVTYFANNSRSLVAAFVGTLPMLTLITFVLIYLTAGQTAVTAYAKGLMIMIVPWMIFILSVILLASRMSFLLSLLVGLCIQIAVALLILARLNGSRFGF